MRVIENSKKSKNFNLKEFNNFENKTTEFFNFICELCRKYNMKIYKVVKTYSIELGKISKRINVTRVKDGKTYFIYCSSIVPCIDE
ncbi:hypothetical protein ACV3RS_15190 [Clostridium perfringens]